MPSKKKDDSDGLIHIQVGSEFAPCGARVAFISVVFEPATGKWTRYPEPKEPLQQSCGEELDKATCTQCKARVAQLVRLYRKATRGREKWSEK